LVLEDMVAMRWIILCVLGFGRVLTLIAMIWRGCFARDRAVARRACRGDGDLDGDGGRGERL